MLCFDIMFSAFDPTRLGKIESVTLHSTKAGYTFLPADYEELEMMIRKIAAELDFKYADRLEIEVMTDQVDVFYRDNSNKRRRYLTLMA